MRKGLNVTASVFVVITILWIAGVLAMLTTDAPVDLANLDEAVRAFVVSGIFYGVTGQAESVEE